MCSDKPWKIRNARSRRKSDGERRAKPVVVVVVVVLFRCHCMDMIGMYRRLRNPAIPCNLLFSRVH